MGKQSNQPTSVSQEQFDKDLNSSLNILINDGADDETLELYMDDYKSRFSVKKKGDTTSTSTTKIPSTDSVQKDGSLDSQEFEYKPKIDAKTGKEVYEKDASGKLVPAQEKVLKGYATERETELIKNDELKKKALKPYKPSVSYTQYKKATDVSQEEKDIILSEIESKINNEGVLNKLSTGFRWMGDVIGNKIAPLLGEDINPNLGKAYVDEEKQAIEILKQELKVKDAYQINPKTILEKTKELVLDKKTEGIRIDKNNAFLSNLSEKDKNALNLEKVQNYKTLSDKDKYLITQGELLNTDLEKISKDAVVIKKIIDEHSEKGKELPQKFIDSALILEEQFNLKAKDLDKIGQEYIQNTKNIGSVEEELDFLKRNYDTSNKVKSYVKLGFGDLYVNVAKKLPILISDLDEATLENLRFGGEGVMTEYERQDLIEDIIDWESAKENERSKLKKDVSFENMHIGTNFGEFLAQEVGSQIPIFAQIAMPGGVVSIGMTSTADKYGQMEVENKELGKGYSRSQMFATSVGFGLAETILGSLPTKGILNRSVLAFEKTGQRTLLKEGIGSYIKKKGATIGDDFLMETVTEGMTQLTQNFLDRKILGKTDIGLFDGVSHAAFSGGMFGGGMSIAPAIIGTALRPFSDNKSGKTVRDNMESIFRLQSELNNPDISKVAKKTIEDKINLVESQNKEVLTSIAKKTETMPTEIIDAIIGVTKKQELLTLQASEIKADPSLSKELKKELISGLEVEYNSLEKKRANLVSDKATVLDALPDSEKNKLKERAGKELIKNAEAVGLKEASFNDTQITAKALEIYSKREINKEAKKAEKEQLIVKKTTTDTKEQVTEVEPAPSVSLKEEVIDETTQGKDIISNGDVQPRVEPMGEVAESEPTTTKTLEEKSVPNTNESKPSEGVNEVEYTLNEIDKGILEWSGNISSPRIDLGISWADIRKGESDIKKGKTNTVPAKRLIEAINSSKKEGGYRYKQGVGGKSATSSEFVSFEDMQRTVNVDNITDAELNEILNSENVLLEEYNESFNSLDEETQNEIIENYENKPREIVENTEIRESKNDVLDEKTEEKPTTKERIAERIKTKNAKIDDVANTIKGMDSLFGFKIKADNIDGVDKQGIDFIAVIADIVKQAVAAGIHIDEAIKKTVEHFQKTYDLDSDTINQVKEKLNTKKEFKKNNDKNTFEYNASFVPNSDIIGEYLSGETTEKHTGEKVEVDQTINKVKLVDALRHGVDTIELAKMEYGDDFVSKTLEFLEDANIPPHAKALTYVSLSNELDRQRKEFPEDRSRIQKQIDLVDKKRQNFARQNSLAINMSRLQAFAKIGYDVNEVTEKMFSSQELSDRKKIEKTVEATADKINEEYARQEEGEDDFNTDFVMSEPKSIRTIEDAKKDLNDALKALKLDWSKLSRGGTLNATIPGYKQVEVAAPHIFKIAKAMIEIGGYTTKEIIETIYNNLGNAFPAVKKKDISDVLRNKYDKGNVSKTTTPKVKKASKEIKDLLIEAGYSREANVTVNQKDVDGNNVLDTKGNVVRVKERRTYFDWKKLAGEEGSVANMKERVEKVLKLKRYSDAQIQEANIRLKDEYTDLRASIIEKGIREMNNRNKVKPSVKIKETARKLAELYNFGIFEENTSQYNQLLNSALGFSEFQEKTYEELEKYGKALASLMSVDSKYAEGQKLSDISIKTITAQINHDIKKIISAASLRSGTKAYRFVNVLSDYTNLSQLSKLMSLKQLIENPASGFIERQFQHVGEMFDKIDTKDLKADRKKLAKFVYEDIVRHGGLHYGDVSTTLVNKSKVEDWLNSQSDNQVYHTVVSAMTARAYLNGADSFNKALITEKMFNQNIVKMLTSDSNPNGKMTKTEAIALVSKTLTGQNKEDALKTAEEVIDKVNESVGFEVIKKNNATIFRFAQDIVKETLLVGSNLTIDNITDAYNAGYKSAGFSLGHEANNWVSKIVGSQNARIDVQLEKAVKEKKWKTAVSLTFESILIKNIINPFLGGGMNWAILGASKYGVNPISMYLDWVHKKDNSLDMTTEQGVKNVQNALMRDTNFKKTAARNLIGSAVSISMVAAMIASGADDDLDDWLKKNKWAEKYFNILSPPMVVAILAYENEELGKYIIGAINMKTDQMNEFMNTFKSLQDSKTSTLGAVGKLSGTAFDTPIPWRMVKDVKNVARGINGLPIIKSDYNKTGFWNGYFQGGFIDEIEFRPGVNYELKEKIQIVKDEASEHSDKIKKIADKYSDGKLSDTQMEEAVREAILEDVEKAEKTIDILKDRIPKNEMDKLKDPFYLSFKRESNDEVRALLFFDKFGDVQNLSEEMFNEMAKNMEIIRYNPSDDFNKYYNEIKQESKKPNKE